MPLVLKGKLKSRLDIQWESSIPVYLQLTITENQETVLFLQDLGSGSGKIQLELSQLDLEPFYDASELDLVALLKGQDGNTQAISESCTIQKCHHPSCGQWGHVREDGYCKHCGRRIRNQSYSHGFRKLEIGTYNITLWNNTEGKLSKLKENREDEHCIFSTGRYESKYHYRDYAEIIEEKFDLNVEKKYLHLHEILQQSDLLDKFWKPPYSCFQEQEQRTIWIYYPRLAKQPNWRNISALSYILSKNADILTSKEIVQIGIQLCGIARKIRHLGYNWGGTKLSDLILCRDREKNIAIYLRSKDISWNGIPTKALLDSCLMPWELFWENNSSENNTKYERTEIYIIAAILYFLCAKSPNLLAYNSLSYQYGLPAFKLFQKNQTENTPTKNPIDDHLESVLNPALILNPQERGYQTLQEFQAALELLAKWPSINWLNTPFSLDTGYALDIGYEKCDDDLSMNQDAIFATTYTLRKKQWGMFALCDGISTATIGSGDQASQIIVNTFHKWWKNTNEEERKNICSYARYDFKKGCEFLSSLINEANEKIAEAVEKLGTPESLKQSLIMGSTISTGLIYEGSLLFAWLGDSPIYRICRLGWERLNYEDNERNHRLSAGMPLDECFFEGGDSLTRCVGANFYIEKNLELHYGHTFFYPGEHILICSDGIPDYIEQEPSYIHHENYQMLRIASILNQYDKDSLLDAKTLATILISTVNRAGGGYDNLSAILISTVPSTPMQEISYKKLRLLSDNLKLLTVPSTVHEAKTIQMPQIL